MVTSETKVVGVLSSYNCLLNEQVFVVCTCHCRASNIQVHAQMHGNSYVMICNLLGCLCASYVASFPGLFCLQYMVACSVQAIKNAGNACEYTSYQKVGGKEGLGIALSINGTSRDIQRHLQDVLSIRILSMNPPCLRHPTLPSVSGFWD